MSKKIVQLKKEIIKSELKELVRGSVEETLNDLLEKEADALTQAGKYERTESRQQEVYEHDAPGHRFVRGLHCRLISALPKGPILFCA